MHFCKGGSVFIQKCNKKWEYHGDLVFCSDEIVVVDVLVVMISATYEKYLAEMQSGTKIVIMRSKAENESIWYLYQV